MATVVYALSGEGRGHATRAQTIIEELRAQHDIKVYAYGQAADFLAPIYRATQVEVRRIPGLQFHYTGRGSLDYFRTLLSSTPYLLQLRSRVDGLCLELARDAPALVITDFEPLLPRAARRLGIPFISLDHQHFLTSYDLSALPARLRYYATCLRPWVQLYYRGQAHSIVSSFYEAPLLAARCRDTTRVGVLLRSEILGARPSHGPHLVAYVRRHVPARFLDALIELGHPVHVYGLGVQTSRGRVSFHAIDAKRFVDDLASCRALVCTAGNQLVGEALYLGKPVLGLPEAGNFEQAINAHFLQASGMGHTLAMHAIDVPKLKRFLGRVELLRERIDPRAICGNAATSAVLCEYLRRVAPRNGAARAYPPLQEPRANRARGGGGYVAT